MRCGLPVDSRQPAVGPYTGQERGTGNTICNQENVTSAVFVPESKTFWVASGAAPVCGNPYIRFEFDEGFRPESLGEAREVLDGYKWQNKSHQKGIAAYMDAIVYRKKNMGDLEGILARVTESVKADPSEPVYTKNQARLLIHLGRYREAITVLQKSLDLTTIPNERALALLTMAKAYDLSGNREQAISHYRKVIGMNKPAPAEDHFSRLNHFVNAYAEAGLKAPFTEEQMNDIPILSAILD